MTSGKEALNRIKPKFREETVPIILRHDLLVAFLEADEALAEARVNRGDPEEDAYGGSAADRRRAVGAATSAREVELAERVQALEQELNDTALQVTFRACSKDEWQALVDNHPPREDDTLDQYAGYNRDAVLGVAVRKCLIDPVFEDCDIEGCTHKPNDDGESCGSWQAFERMLNPNEWGELKKTVNSVNRAVVDLPKSVLASETLRKRGRGSVQLASGG